MIIIRAPYPLFFPYARQFRHYLYGNTPKYPVRNAPYPSFFALKTYETSYFRTLMARPEGLGYLLSTGGVNPPCRNDQTRTIHQLATS